MEEEPSGNEMPTGVLCEHIAAFWDDRVIVFGGIKRLKMTHGQLAFTSIPNDTIWTFKPDNDCWVPYVIPHNQPVPRVSRGCAVMIDDALYMFGGKEFVHKFNSQPTNALWKLYKHNSHEFRWTRIEFENQASQPSPRYYHTCWEYDDKLWSFAGQGPQQDGYLSGGNSEKFIRHRDRECNNQLLCYDPMTGEWSIPQTRGPVPDPARCVKSARVANVVWVYSAFYAVMYALHMKTLVWVSVEVSGWAVPRASFPTFTAVTDTQIILHGGTDIVLCEPLDETWIFDTDSTSWHQYTGKQDHVRYKHTSVKVGNQSLVVFGGCLTSLWNGPPVRKFKLYKDIHWIKLEPDSLRKLALKAVYKYRHLLLDEWASLPRSLYDELIEMCAGECW